MIELLQTRPVEEIILLRGRLLYAHSLPLEKYRKLSGGLLQQGFSMRIATQSDSLVKVREFGLSRLSGRSRKIEFSRIMSHDRTVD